MGFESAKECRTCLDWVFETMSRDPEMGPKLRDAETPQRWEFPDLELVVNVTAAEDGEEANLRWEWSDDVSWEPEVLMTMDSAVANRYFQGKENIAMAVARRRIKTSGNLKKAPGPAFFICCAKASYRRISTSLTDLRAICMASSK